MPTIICNGRSVELVPVHFTPILEPATCPHCDAPTTRINRGKTGANLYCTDPACNAAGVRRIIHWCGSSKKGIGILDLGDTMIQALWDTGLVKDQADLYTLTVDMIKDVTMASGVRIGSSRATTIVDNIQAKAALPLDIFLGALGIDLLGTRRAKLLMEAAGGALDTLDQWLDDTVLAQLDIPGMQGTDSTTRAAIRAGIHTCRPLISKLLSVGVTILPAHPAPTQPIAQDFTETPKEATAKPLAGISICFTGTRALIKEAEAAGAVIKDGVSKGLQILVQKDASSVSNKTKKAIQYGTKVIGLDTLQAILDGIATLP